LTRYLCGGHTHRPQIEKAKEQLNAYLTQGRLWIVDQRKTANELQDTLDQFSGEHDIGAVFIDYIQKIPSTGQFGTRQLELQKTSGLILETATSLHIPILLGAQLNRGSNQKSPGNIKLENLREAGDIEQDANLVLAIYNEAMDNLLSGDEIDMSDSVPLSIQVLKNRNGIPMINEYLEFRRSTLLIQDQSFSAMSSRLAA
jgi:replicative DNA helicase